MKVRPWKEISRQRLLVLMPVLALLAAPAIAQGRVGGLDPSFGVQGRLTTSFPSGATPTLDEEPGGSVVLSEGGSVYRLLPDGEPDPEYGEGGRVVLPTEVEGLELRLGPVRVDSLGRVVVSGSAIDRSQIFLEPVYMLHAQPSWPVVFRLNPDGSIDKTFGGGKGFVRSDFGVKSEFETELSLVRIGALRIDSENRLVMVMTSAGITGRCNYGHTAIADYPRAIVRLTTGGEVDSAFGGGDGNSPVSGAEYTAKLELDTSDQPAVAVTPKSCRRGSKVFRFGADGLPLGSFGTDGSRFHPGLYFSGLDLSGGLILHGGEQPVSVAVTQLNGDLDPAFGNKGISNVRMPAGANRTLRPVGVDANGGVVLVGSMTLPKPQKRPPGSQIHDKKKRRPSRSYVLVTRLTPAGRPDPRFGNHGWIITRFDRLNDIEVGSTVIDSQGRLLVAVGSDDARQAPGTHLVLARYLLDR